MFKPGTLVRFKPGTLADYTESFRELMLPQIGEVLTCASYKGISFTNNKEKYMLCLMFHPSRIVYNFMSSRFDVIFVPKD